jgi:hypothetical protein
MSPLQKKGLLFRTFLAQLEGLAAPVCPDSRRRKASPSRPKAADENITVDSVAVTNDILRCCFPTVGLRQVARWVRCHAGPAGFWRRQPRPAPPPSDPCGAIAVAKRICRTADRLDQAGMPGLRRRVGRAASLPAPQIVSKILQRGSHALIAEQGCAGFARCSGRWPHSLPADPGRIAPSIRPDLISGRQLFLKTCSKPERPKIALVGTPCPYQKPHPGLKRDEQHVRHLETHAHPA